MQQTTQAMTALNRQKPDQASPKFANSSRGYIFREIAAYINKQSLAGSLGREILSSVLFLDWSYVDIRNIVRICGFGP